MLLRLVLQIIENGSKERTRTFQAALYISLTKIANEGNDIKKYCSDPATQGKRATGTR